MMKSSFLKKIVCLAVCMLLVLSLPLMAFAEEEEPLPDAQQVSAAAEDVDEAGEPQSGPVEPAEPEKAPAEEPGASDEAQTDAPAVSDIPAVDGAPSAEPESGTIPDDDANGVLENSVVPDSAGQIPAVKRTALKAAPLRASAIDNSTTLPDGEYTDFEFEWAGGTGKAKLDLDRIVVSGGKATGYFTASKPTLSHVYYLGHTGGNDEDPAYYDPATDTCGQGVLPIINQEVSFPVVLNKSQDTACRSTAMSVPKWIQYNYTITIEESGDEPEPPKTHSIRFIAVDKDTGKTVSGAVITVTDPSGKTVSADSAGKYILTEGYKYSIKATATDYENAVLDKYAPTADETVTIKMTHVEVIPPGTTVFKEDPNDPSKTNLYNTTAMFKVIKGTLVSKGNNSTLTIVLSGAGYHYLYKGTYEQCLAGGIDESKWIAGRVNSDGKWEFVIPVGQTETFIPVVAISNTHLEKAKKGEETLGDAIFARQLVIDPKAVTLTAGDYDAVIDIQVISKTDVFKADSKGTMEVIGGPNSNNYACNPVITMLDERFSKAFIGTAADAAKDGAAVINKASGSFTFSFVNTFGSDGKVMMFEDKKPIAVAFYDTKDSKWVDYKLTIDKSASTVTIEALGEDEAPPEKPSQPDKKDKDASSSSTRKVDNSTGLADGTYKPDSFSFSGGTGKVRIVCDSIEIKDGKAYATIRFTKKDGSPASVDMLKASGKTYSGSNKFTIPVQLNKNNKIVARTSAMSQPHWIEYTIYVGLDAAGGASGGGGLSNTADFDEEAPAILGLTATGEVETPFSDLVKIFSYEGGYYLIELDAVRDTARDTVEERTVIEAEVLKGSDPDAAGTDSAGEQAEEVSEADEEEGASESDSISVKIAGLYKNEILKYLVVPYDKEVPAGMDKEILIIKQPVERAYVSSADAYSMLEDMGHDGNVTMIGFEDARNEKTFAGPFDDWDLKAMLLEKTDLAVQSSEILPSDKKPVEESMDDLVRLGERAAQLGFAMFIDRSRDEASSLGTSEWLKVYGVILNDMDTALALYEEATDSAADSEKETVLGILKTRAEEKAEMKAQAKEAASKA